MVHKSNISHTIKNKKKPNNKNNENKQIENINNHEFMNINIHLEKESPQKGKRKIEIKDNFEKEFESLVKQIKEKNIPDISLFYKKLKQVNELHKTDYFEDVQYNLKNTFKKIHNINKKNDINILVKDFIHVIKNENIDYKSIFKADVNNSNINNKEEFLNNTDFEKLFKFDRNYNITWKTIKTTSCLRSFLIKIYKNILNF